MSVFLKTDDCTDDTVSTFLQKHLEKLLRDSGKSGAQCRQRFCGADGSTATKGLRFTDFTSQIANVLYENISLSINLTRNRFCCGRLYKWRFHCFAIRATNKSAYTHQVITDENGIHNEIMKHYAILPAPSPKIDSYAIINMKTGEIRIFRIKSAKSMAAAYMYFEYCSNVHRAFPQRAVKIVKGNRKRGRQENTGKLGSP